MQTFFTKGLQIVKGSFSNEKHPEALKSVRRNKEGNGAGYKWVALYLSP